MTVALFAYTYGLFPAGWFLHFWPVHMLFTAKVCISAQFSLLKGSLMDSYCLFVISMMWWLKFEIPDFPLEIGNFQQTYLDSFSLNGQSLLWNSKVFCQRSLNSPDVDDQTSGGHISDLWWTLDCDCALFS